MTESFHGLPEHLFDGSRKLVFLKLLTVNPKIPKQRAFLLLSDYFILGRVLDDGKSYRYMTGASLEKCSVDKQHRIGDLHCFELTVTDDGRPHLLVMGSEKKEEAVAVYKELDLLIRDVKLKATTIKRKEKRESTSAGGGGGASGGHQGSSIGRAIGKVLHRRNKSDLNEESISPPAISPATSPKATSPREVQKANRPVVPPGASASEKNLGSSLRGSTRTEEPGKSGSKKGKGHRRTQSSATWEEKKAEERTATVVVAPKPTGHQRTDSATKGPADMFFESMSGYQREPPSPRNTNIRNLNWDEIE